MRFQNPQLPLADLLKDVRQGKLQLPDFQREYKWDDERIRSLLATVTLGHPMGVIMILETGGDQTRFKPRWITGVHLSGDRDPEHLLLDGQQRMTSLYGALGSGQPVETTVSRERKKRIRRWYYLDINKALDDPAARDDAIASVPEDRKLRSDFGRKVDVDLSTREAELAAGLFPLALAYDMGEAMGWLFAYAGMNSSRQLVVQRFQAEVLTPMHSYKIPAIELTKETTKEAVCTVFEKVNTGGLALDVFELLTAMFAGDKAYYDQHQEDFRLNEHWEGIKGRLKTRPALASVQSSDFLQGVTLLATLDRRRQVEQGSVSGKEVLPAISARRADILKLSLHDYQVWAEELEQGFMWASTFLANEHIFAAYDLPYRTQLVPLACLRPVIGPTIDNHATARRIQQWFWCGVLGERYGGAVETRFARDVEQVPAWATGRSAEAPETVATAGFVESRLLSLKSRQSSAYKGMHALLMRDGSKDWAKNVTIGLANFIDLNVDVHHIFPYAWCNKNGVDNNQRDSIVNKTPLSAETNRSIGGQAPSSYMSRLERKTGLGAGDLDAVVCGHRVDASALRRDDFDSFFSARLAALVDLVEQAIGKKVVRDVSVPDGAAAIDDDRPEHYDPEADDTEDDAQLAGEVSA